MENFKNNVFGLTMKPLLHIRWESHVESVKAIKYELVHIRDALLEIAEVAEDSKTMSDAETLALYDLESFEFLLGMIIWYNLLHAINVASKFIQSEKIDIDIVIDLLQRLFQFLEEFREQGFACAMDEATQMASEMGVEPKFQEKRIIPRKKQLDEGDNDNSKPLNSLMKSCMELQQFLSHGEHSNINGDELCLELMVVRCYITNEKGAIDMMQCLAKLHGLFPNTCVAYKILLNHTASNSCISRKKLLEVEVNQELSSFNNVAR
ncbi:uncharacterized protein LOC142519596 [Primulina tabacum]|uniref:uncharacterized protein LOC142519596 n=1 Tax=Primulina tabacum TaxID=48773 RepID=UPI003F59EF20